MTKTSKLICSVDVGITNLGISLSKVEMEPEFTLENVIRSNTFTLPEITRKTCKKSHCVQYGDNSFSHHVRHFVEEESVNYFDLADLILIERQPATMYTAIEQLLNYIFPEKVLLQSPMTLHRWMGTVGLCRQQKKQESLRRAFPYVKNLPGFQNLKAHRHDLADAVVYTLLYLDLEKEKYASTTENAFRHFQYEYDIVESKYFAHTIPIPTIQRKSKYF